MWRRGIDIGFDNLKCHSGGVKRLYDLQQMPGTLRDMVETGDHHGIAGPDILQKFV